MLVIIQQTQRALSALTQLLALAPIGAQGRLADVLGTIGLALQVVGGTAPSLPGLLESIATLREQIEAITASADGLSEDDLADALTHLQSASHSFRSAITNRQRFT